MIQIDMDMPEYCGVNECPLCNLGWREKTRYTEWCHRPNGNGFVMVGYHGEGNKIPDDCPLKEVKQGKWEQWVSNEDQTNSLWRCTSCGIVVADRKYFLWKYCPNCGSRMDK